MPPDTRSGECLLVGVPPADLDRVWPDCINYLQRALDYNDDGPTIDEVKVKIESRECLLWVAYHEQELVMALVLTTEANRLFMWLMGGINSHLWADDVISAVKRYALECGMKGVKSVSVPGVARKLKQCGFKKTHELLRFDHE